MTNKERLQANNAKIEEIQRTLNGKMLEANKDMKKLLDGTLEEFDNKEWKLTSLRTYQFTDMTNLKNVDLTGITEIPERAVSGCSSINTLVVDKNTTLLGEYALDKVGLNAETLTLDFGIDVVCKVSGHAIYNSGITSLKGKFSIAGTYAISECSNLKEVDVTITGTSIGQQFLRECPAIQSLKLNLDNFTGTTIPQYFLYGCGSDRPTPENNIIVLDFRNCTFTTIDQNAFAGSSALRPKYMRYFFPSTLTTINKNAFNYTSYCRTYFKNSTPPTLGTGTYNGATGYLIFVPHNNIKAYKTATNWTAKQSYIRGWAEENTFEQGAVLPTTNDEGLTLTWYSDENMTTQVTSVEDATQIYYCIASGGV